MKHPLPAFLLFAFLFMNCAPEAAPEKHSGKPPTAIQLQHPAGIKDTVQLINSGIVIQPYAGLNEELVTCIYTALCKVHPHVILLKPIPLPHQAYYVPRKRYRADTLILLLKNTTHDGFVTIGLTDKDISTDKDQYPDWGVMGLGYQPGKACVVSTFRLNKKNLQEQFFKVVIHELGHTQGLPHCPNKTCYMQDAEGKNTTDQETGFCEKCKAFLVGKGWKME